MFFFCFLLYPPSVFLSSCQLLNFQYGRAGFFGAAIYGIEDPGERQFCFIGDDRENFSEKCSLDTYFMDIHFSNIEI